MFNNMIYSIVAEICEDEDAYMTRLFSNITEQHRYNGGVVPEILGSILSNGVAVFTEMIKTEQVVNAIQDLKMFQGTMAKATRNGR